VGPFVIIKHKAFRHKHLLNVFNKWVVMFGLAALFETGDLKRVDRFGIVIYYETVGGME
jgi:hypothetical protein